MRYPWVDRVKVVVIAGVIVVHVAATYLVNTGWYYQELTTSAVVPALASIPLGIGAIYGLAPLFLVSGQLTRVSVSKHGASGFVRSRLIRLGVPVVAYLLLVDPFSRWLGAVADNRTLWSHLTGPPAGRDLGEMWFVVALLVFSLAYAVRPLPRVPAGPRLLVTLAGAVAVADFAVWLRWSYLADTAWNLNWTHWPQAAGLFALGAFIGVDALPAGFARRCGWVALAGLAAVVALWAVAIAAGKLDALAGGWHWGTVLFAVLDGTTALALSVWFTDWFRRRWNQPAGAVMARAASGSYATYVLHPPVLVALSLAARPLPWPPEAKFALVAAVGVPASFAVGYLVTLVRRGISGFAPAAAGVRRNRWRPARRGPRRG